MSHISPLHLRPLLVFPSSYCRIERRALAFPFFALSAEGRRRTNTTLSLHTTLHCHRGALSLSNRHYLLSQQPTTVSRWEEGRMRARSPTRQQHSAALLWLGWQKGPLKLPRQLGVYRSRWLFWRAGRPFTQWEKAWDFNTWLYCMKCYDISLGSIYFVGIYRGLIVFSFWRKCIEY